MKEFLSVDEVCTYLNTSRSYVYKLSFNNDLPKYRPTGKKIWFKRQDIDAFVEKGRIASQDEIKSSVELDLYKRSKLKK